MGARVGIDTGGTFTDLVSVDSLNGRLVRSKRPSTPAYPERAVLDALDRVHPDAAGVEFLIVGSTIATNALLQRRGARVLYLTTAGFEDVLYIQRIHRKFHYDLSWRKPDPLVARRDCIGVNERIGKDGSVVRALGASELERVRGLVGARLGETDPPTAVAINLLFGYANPVHEEQLANALRTWFPELAVSASHRVASIWREYERGSTVVADAYVKPMIRSFVRHLDQELTERGHGGHWAVMKSNGSNALASAAVDQPVQLVLSGLAGGLVAGRHYGRQVGAGNVISLDMGGTSTDVGVITDGEIGYTTEYQIEWGIPIAAPFIDLTTIGAGGGSVAWTDKGGFPRVGPLSTGADPGPACYGRGGTEPTVTDANLVLGRLNPTYFLGGEMQLDVRPAWDAVARFGRAIGQSAEDTALSIVELANENMANAIRLLTIERGIDPRDYDLVAFGGAGPVHAVDLARAVGIGRVVVPPHPGYGSALGTLLADLRIDRIWTQAFRSTDVDWRVVDGRFAELVASSLAELRTEGFLGEPLVQRSISMRYLGQNYEQNVSVPPGPIDPDAGDAIVERFHRQHASVYGYRIDGEVVELIHFNVSVVGPTQPIEIAPLGEFPPARPTATRTVRFRGSGPVETPLYRRGELGAGTTLVGPAIVEEEDSTTVLPPGAAFSVHPSGALVVAVGSA